MNAILGSLARIWAIALNTLREGLRNRVLAVLVLFAVGLMGFSLVLGQLSLYEEVRVIKDLGLAGISLCCTVIALFLGVNLLSKELDRKTVYFVIPKPVHRWEFLVGKFVGMVVTLAILVVTMAVILAVFLQAQGGHHDLSLLRAEVLVLFELALLVAVAMLFSSFSSPYLSAMCTAALWVIGRNSLELRALARGKLQGTSLQYLFEALTRVLPDFHLFYISGVSLPVEGAQDRVTTIHETFVSWAYVGQAGLYAAAYAAICLVLATLLFARRDFT